MDGVWPAAIHATGGAAANREILQVLADVFGAEVYRFDATDSAALGAALHAWQADTGLEWELIVRDFALPLPADRILPDAGHVRTYQALQDRYIALEAAALSG